MLGKIIDIIMMLSMFLQIFYVFFGNLFHEILGVIFFVCILIHIYLKRKWLAKFFKKSNKQVLFAKIIIAALTVGIIILIISSIGVSKSLFINECINCDKDFHVIIFAIVTVLTVIHIGMHGYVRRENKKKIVIFTSIFAVVAFCMVIFLVPYLNRHFKTVKIGDMQQTIQGKHIDIDKKVLVVYFTRVGNTNFKKDVDAVSGASLMQSNKGLVGNTQLLAGMVKDAYNCDMKAIKLENKKDYYPSSYADTCMAAKKEFDNDVVPKIEKIDVNKYDDIILVYPIWWYKAPMPVVSFLKSCDFKDKNIFLLATSGSRGFAKSTEDIKKYSKAKKVVEGLSIYCDDIPKSRETVGNWLESIKNDL